MKKYGISILLAVMGICLAGQAGVVAYYSFDDPANMTTDDSGNGHTLAVFSGYGTPTYDAAGKYGGASSFNGTDQGWIINDFIYPATGSFSFSAWVKTAGTTTMITQSWGTGDGFDLYVGAGSYRFLTRYNGTYDYVIGSAGPTDGIWQHIAMTYEATSGPDVDGVYTGTIRGYLNGELIATKTDAHYERTTSNDMAIGRRSTAVFNGLIDEIYIHDIALTEAEIRVMADYSGVVAHYSFNNPANLTVDDSGNGHTLTVFSGYGTPTYDATGKYGGGGSSFNGTDQGWFISNYIYPAGSFSFSAWVKPSGTVEMITQPWGTGDGFDVYVGAGSYRFMTRYGAGLYSYCIGNAGPTNDVWQHIAMTYEATSGPDTNEVYTGTIKGYLNGQVIATATNAHYKATTINDMAIGRRSGNAFTGGIDEIYIHAIALTQAEIQALMLPGVNYEDWADSYALDGVDADRNADPEGDGMENLLEYALGGDPTVDDSGAIQPSLNSGAGGLVYVYNRRLDAVARGLDYGVLLSDDLTMGWMNIGTNDETGSVSIDAAFEKVTNTVSTVADEGYVSLEVVEN